jgi:hypothetical protein
VQRQQRNAQSTSAWEIARHDSLLEINPRMLRERVKNKKADRLAVICLSTP